MDLTRTLFKLYGKRKRETGRYNVSELWAISRGIITPENYFRSKISLAGLLRMWKGSMKHEAIEELLKELGWETEVKKEYQHKDFTVVGKVDAMSSKQILEIKTSDKLLTAQESHIYQLKIYLSLFERPYGYIVQPVILRNRLQLKFLKKVERDDTFFQKNLLMLEDFHNKLLWLVSNKN